MYFAEIAMVAGIAGLVGMIYSIRNLVQITTFKVHLETEKGSLYMALVRHAG